VNGSSWGSRGRAGFDAKLAFVTPLGKLTALKLRDACGAENKKLLAERPTYIGASPPEQVSAVREEARRQVKSAGTESDPEDKVEELTAAIKGFAGCGEQAELLLVFKDERWREAKPTKGEAQALKGTSRAAARGARSCPESARRSEERARPESRQARHQSRSRSHRPSRLRRRSDAERPQSACTGAAKRGRLQLVGGHDQRGAELPYPVSRSFS